jgi:hypothetical protein
MDDLVQCIERLRDEAEDLRVSLTVAEQVPKLEAKIKKLETEVIRLRAERERISRALS